MVNIADPLTQWAFRILVSVVMGTCLLIAVAFFRRWQQIRYVRYVHALRRKYRPILAKLLSGEQNPAGVEALRELTSADLEILLDPLFSKRKLPDRCLIFLQALCAELGLIELWQKRLANGHPAASLSSGHGGHQVSSDRPTTRHMLRAKSIRNLGMLRHRPSWPLLVSTLDGRHADLQLMALRSLAALSAPESFPVLWERLHAVVRGESTSLPLRALEVAIASFDLTCAPALFPALRHPDHQIRLHATEILRTMIFREAGRQPHFALKPELLTPQLVEMLLDELPADTSAEIRARSAEVMVFLADPRAPLVLRDLLLDHQWFVRLRTVRALARRQQAPAPLHLDIRECLRDSHWRVREAAIQTLISIGQEGKRQLYEHFLTSSDGTTRRQIVEVIERTGLMSDLVEDYGAGTTGVDALIVEQLASDGAPLGLSGVLRTLDPEIRRKFLDRYIPYAKSGKTPLPEGTRPEVERARDLQQALEFPPSMAA